MVEMAMSLQSGTVVREGDLGLKGTVGGDKIIESFCRDYLLHRPKPRWIVVDPQASFVDGTFAEFAQRAGIGMLATPGEAHWHHGFTERRVQILKRVMRRLRNELPEVQPRVVLWLALAAANSLDRVKGHAPVQWAFGKDFKEDVAGPSLINSFRTIDDRRPDSDFWLLQRHRSTAESIWIQEDAAEKVSRLLKSAPRPIAEYKRGDWVCVWRVAAGKREAKVNPEPSFVGPGRVVLIEPAVKKDGKDGCIWVVMGTRV